MNTNIHGGRVGFWRMAAAIGIPVALFCAGFWWYTSPDHRIGLRRVLNMRTAPEYLQEEVAKFGGRVKIACAPDVAPAGEHYTAAEVGAILARIEGSPDGALISIHEGERGQWRNDLVKKWAGRRFDVFGTAAAEGDGRIRTFIFIDKTLKTPLAFYEGGGLMGNKCHACHPNGPRAVHAEFASDREGVEIMNAAMDYGRVETFSPPEDPITHGGILPVDKSCVECHHEGEDGRGTLREEHGDSAKLLVSIGVMPKR